MITFCININILILKRIDTQTRNLKNTLELKNKFYELSIQI
jgi:hypothetical protein